MRRLLLLTIVLTGCGRAPVDATIAGLLVQIVPDEARFSIARPDGTLLVDAFAGEAYQAGTPPHGLATSSPMVDIQQEYGSYLFTETPPPWSIARRFGDVSVRDDSVTAALDDIEGGQLAIDQSASGNLQITIANAKDDHVSLALRTPVGEHFLGMGAHSQDVDDRGGTVASWVSEQGIGQSDTDDPTAAWFFQGTRHQTYFPLPFLLSSRGYGFEVGGFQRVVFSLASEAPDLLRIESGSRSATITLYDGPTIPEVLAHRTASAGRPPVPPDWTFAPWNDAIYGEDNVSRVAGVLRSNHIPSGAIWTEDWAGGTQSGDSYTLTYEWKVDRTLYPNVEMLAAQLHSAGFRFLAYFNTFVESDASHFAEVRDAGYMVAQQDGTPYLFSGARFVPTGLLDLSNAAARGYLGERMDAALDLGFDGWMADFGEWLPTDSKLSSGELGLDVHNRYPVDWQQLNETIFSGRPEPDQLQSFVRSGYTGSGGVAHQVVWGGDQLVNFGTDDGLPTVIPLAIGLGLSGLPYFGSDIGGYTNLPGSPPRSKELFFRWTTLGAFSVIMRTHHGVWPLQNWAFDSDADTVSHFGRWARVHTRMFPYLKALAGHFVDTGLPIMRPLALAFPAEDSAFTDTTEMMLGPSLLVAPITEEGATSRSVYLPSARWIPISFAADGTPTSAGAALSGGTIDAGAAVTEIPVYLRAGTLVSLLPEGIETLAPVDDAAGVMGLAQLGTRRTLLVALGAAPDAEGGVAIDDLGGSYTLVAGGAPVGTPTMQLGGAPLPDCSGGASSCTTTLDAHSARVQLFGSGALEVLDSGSVVAHVDIAARSSDASLEVFFVW